MEGKWSKRIFFSGKLGSLFWKRVTASPHGEEPVEVARACGHLPGEVFQAGPTRRWPQADQQHAGGTKFPSWPRNAPTTAG